MDEIIAASFAFGSLAYREGKPPDDILMNGAHHNTVGG